MRMYSQRLLWLSGIVVLSAIILYSCQDDSVNPGQSDPVADNTLSAKERISNTIARNLALNMNSTTVKSFIKGETLKRFSGEDNFLIVTHLDESITLDNGRTEQKTFLQVISGATEESRVSSAFVDSLIQFYPLLQVTVYVPDDMSVEDWDITDTPLVAFVLSGDSVAIAYDSDGNYSQITEEPNEVVIVISENEMTVPLTADQIGNASCQALSDLSPYFSTEYYSLYLATEYYDALNTCVIEEVTTIDNESGRIALPCDRDVHGGKDELWRFRFATGTAFDNAKKNEGLFNNTLEMYVNILFGQSNGAVSRLTKIFQTKQKNLESKKWYYSDVEIITWSKSTYGDAILYSWLESDGGGSTTTTATWQSKYDNTTTTLTSTYTIPNDHLKLGESIPEYCDLTLGEGTEYNTGSIVFNVRKQQ